MTIKTSFTPEMIQEIVKGYEMATAFLDKFYINSPSHEEVAKHVMEIAGFGIEDRITITAMAITYFNKNLIKDGYVSHHKRTLTTSVLN